MFNVVNNNNNNKRKKRKKKVIEDLNERLLETLRVK